jgi:large subunit ribosomal protein L13
MNARLTTMAKPETTQEKWYIVDASGQVVGRLAARIATLVKGKRLVNYTPHVDPKVHVIITNADKVVFSGDKMATKTYKWHSRFRTGLKEESAEHLLDRRPEEVIRRAIHGMLPKNRLGSQMNRHLRIYSSGEYTGQHDAQQPEPLVIKTRQPRKKV